MPHKKILIMAALVLIVVGCSKTKTSTSGLSCNGIWLKSLEKAYRLVPVGDGRQAWVIAEDGLYVVDALGSVRSKINFPSDSWRPYGQGRYPAIRIASDGRHAWLLMQDNRLFYVETTGNAREIQHPLVQKLEPFEFDAAWLTSDGAHLWMRVSDSQEIVRIGADGNAALFTTEVKKKFFNGRLDGRPALDNNGSWVLYNGYQTDVGPTFNDHQTIQALYLLDERGNGSNVLKALSGGVNLGSLKFVEEGKYGWMLATDSGLYGIRDDGVILNDGKPYLQTTKVRKIKLSEDEKHLWVLPDGNGLYALKGDGTFINNGEPLLDQKQFDTIFPAGQKHALATSKDGEIYIVDIEGHSIKTDSKQLEHAKVRGVIAATDEKNFWVFSQDGRLYILQSDGTVLNSGNPVPDVMFDLPKEDKFDRNDEYTDEDKERKEKSTLSQELHLTSNASVLVVSSRNNLSLVDTDGNSTKIQTPYSNSPDISRIEATTDHKQFWVSVYGQAPYVVTESGKVFSGSSESLSSVDIGQLYPANDGKHGWTEGGWVLGGPYVVGVVESPDDLKEIRISFGSSFLSREETLSLHSDKSVILTKDPQNEPWTFDLDWPGSQSGKNIKGTVSIQVNDEFGRVAYASSNIEDKRLSPVWEKGIKWNTPYQVGLIYTDGFGSKIQFIWPSVQFNIPFWQRPLVRTSFVFLIVLAIAFSLLRWTPYNSPSQRLLPIICWLAAAGLANLHTVESFLNINGILLLSLLLGALLLALPLGLISPPAFREIVKTEPFRHIAPYALLLNWVKRRLFDDYVRSCERQVEVDRIAAYDESYVPVPAKMIISAASAREKEIAKPSSEVLKVVTALQVNDRVNVLIESPGGRGKSALLREILELALAQFKNDARHPLPVICDGRGETIQKMVTNALGRYLITSDALDLQLRSGDFFIVIDGLSESTLSAGLIRDFIKGDHGAKTSLLLTTRPDDSYHRAIQNSDRWAIVEPKRLDDSTLPLFEQVYLESDAQGAHATSAALSLQLKNACRAADGTYLPILIRFALRANRESVQTIGDLYSATFAQLLKGQSAVKPDLNLQDAASTLCVDTYWRDGYRTLPYALAKEDRKVLLEKLLNAGIIIPADESPTLLRREPQQVKFFHDSMQSFLAARGLFISLKDVEDWTVLQRAAGDPKFVRAQSDLFTGEGSEIFQMCLHVFSPIQRLREALHHHLAIWAEVHDGDLRKNDVLGAVPKSLREKVEATVSTDDSPGNVLHHAIDCCMVEDSGRTIRHLAILYAQIAPLLWPYQKPS